VAHSSLTSLARQVRNSAVLTGVDDVMPDSARTWFSSFRRLLDNYGFPQVFGGLGPESVRSVPPPDPNVLNSPALAAAATDVVKITGDARSCSRQLEGSGFVISARHVMTNAHVVAGVTNPTVLVGGGGPSLAATVVLYDPRRDVAVLFVPGLTKSPLRFAGAAASGSDAVVAGYPNNGPFRAVPARIRGTQLARGPDIYQSTQVTRQIYALRSSVEPGNSGGPLLATDGSVLGVVFAAAVDDPTTGYALTAAEVGPDAAAAAGSTVPTSTRGCD
jgi:S1-C subfamily serine protease